MEGREEEGTLERHSKRRSSGRKEKVVVATVMIGFGDRGLELGSCGFGKQDFISHEKGRELQLSGMKGGCLMEERGDLRGGEAVIYLCSGAWTAS
jgi:hypothetical protein